MMTTISVYQNKRNPNKYLEVHNDGYRHNAIKQFMFWKENMVKNYMGDRKLHRWRKENLNDLLEDYIFVEQRVKERG